jgi:exodeoxyribonuclease VII small subunit
VSPRSAKTTKIGSLETTNQTDTVMADGIPPASDGRSDVEGLTFDAALAEFQRVVAALEEGGQPLEQSIQLYERGVALNARLERLLADAELRIRRLVERAGGQIEARDVRPDEPIEEP